MQQKERKGMTRYEFSKLDYDELETVLRKNGANNDTVEAAMIAYLDGNDALVLDYINGNKMALNEYLDDSLPTSSVVKSNRSHEHRMRCNVCGSIFCYTDKDIQANESYEKEVAGHAMASLLSGLFVSRYLQYEEAKQEEMAKNKIVDYSRCPNCKSTNIKEIFDDNMIAEKPQKEITTMISAADEIRKFKELLDCGIITQAEFEEKKKQLLGM